MKGRTIRMSIALATLPVLCGSLLGVGTARGAAGTVRQAATAQEQEVSTQKKAATEQRIEKPVLKKVYVIQIKNHEFHPARLVVPAGKKIKLRIENLDKTPEEFESYDFNREKIVAGGRKITVFVGPLKPGTYKFFGEFNPKTAQGLLIVR